MGNIPVQPAASKFHQNFYLDFPYPDIDVFEPSRLFRTEAVEQHLVIQ